MKARYVVGVLFGGPILAFVAYVTWLVVPSVVEAVVPAVVKAVL